MVVRTADFDVKRQADFAILTVDWLDKEDGR